jgi:hypothetical protein
MIRFVKVAFSVLRRICYATTIAVATWVLAYRGGIWLSIAKVLDIPIAVSSALTERVACLKGMDLIFGRGAGEFLGRDEILLWHLRASVLVYVALSYVPALMRLAWQHARGRRTRPQKSKPEAY